MGCNCQPAPQTKLNIVRPSVPQMVTGIKSIVKTTLGMGLANSSLRGARLEICQTCPEFANNNLNQCKQCGCIIQLKVKDTSSVCPLGKW